MHLIKLLDDTEVLVHDDNQLVILEMALRVHMIDWYHDYPQHPGETRLKETLCSIFYWHGIRHQVR